MDVPLFRALYPAFATVADPVLAAITLQAQAYLGGCAKYHDQMEMLIVAHMLSLREKATAGDMAGIITGASEGSVSVTLAAPSASKAGDWYNLTPYGKEFMVLARRCGAAGFYVPGRQPFQR